VITNSCRPGGEGGADPGDELLQRYVPVLHRFFASKVGDEVEDLAQRALLGCVQGRERFLATASVKTYLLSIARKQLMMHLRRHYRGIRAMRLHDMSLDHMGVTPSQLAGQREELRLLETALRRITLDLQITVELSYWEDLAISDIATVLEVAPGTIKSRVSRARETLEARVLEATASEHLQRSTVDNLDAWATELRAAFDRAQ